MNLVFDIETDGLEATKVHCIAAREWNGKHLYSFHDYGAYDGDLKTGVEFLRAATRLVGHNIIGYDLPVLRDLYGLDYKGEVYDTLASARFWMPDQDLSVADGKRKDFPTNLFGRHSLEAWGERLGVYKLDPPEDWTHYTPEMEVYCAQDVQTTYALYALLQAKRLPEEARAREQRFALVCHRIRQHGVVFDEAAALELARELQRRRAELQDEILKIHPGWTQEYVTPKRRERKTKFIEFNPNSRLQVAQRLREQGWVPTEFTDTGQPKVSEGTLQEAAKTIPEAALYAERLTVQKRLGFLIEGEQALLTHLTSAGRIHGYVSHNGATTTRCTHNHPNLAQVPAVRSLYGTQFRSLFRAPSGGALVGMDAKGLELRTLAHYLHPYDGGEYVKVVTEGDPHTVNQTIAKLPTRDQAKTLIYALLYGAGDEKLGRIVEGSRRDGRRLRAAILDGITGFRTLVERLKERAESGVIKALDGRVLRVRHQHAVLNTLLQSAGSIIMKEFANGMQTWIDGNLPGRAFIVLQAHDELQVEATLSAEAEQVVEAAHAVIERAGDPFKFRCPLACDAKVGQTWAETH